MKSMEIQSRIQQSVKISVFAFSVYDANEASKILRARLASSTPFDNSADSARLRVKSSRETSPFSFIPTAVPP